MAIAAECPVCKRKQSTQRKRCSCGADLDKEKRSKKVKYHIIYRVDGKQVWKSLASFEGMNPYSLQDARDVEARFMVAKREKKLEVFHPKREANMNFQELTEWYLSIEKVRALSSFWRKGMALKKFNEMFGNMVVCHIKPVDLENYQARRKAEGFADKTIDDEIGEARTMISKAFDNDLVGGDTLKIFKKVGKLLKRNANARDRILSPEEFQNLISKAKYHLLIAISTAYYTGMRLSEVLGLTWNKVDLRGRTISLSAEETKDKEARKIPIGDELYRILKSVPRALHDDHVILYRGKPVGTIKTSLKRACKDAKIEYGRFKDGGFVYHDLRHTFNTYMRKAGVAESVIMAITGHSTREMFDRYNKIDAEDTREAISQMGAFLQGVRQSVRQEQEVEV